MAGEMMFTVGSLFSGIGGIDLAFSVAGFDILFQVEIDPFCQKVLTKHASTYWQRAALFADVREVGSHNLPQVDLLEGGFPCQSVSFAGKQEGIHEGTRSGLWFEFRRIIGDLRPRVVFLENVPGILKNGGTGVIADLTALGYDCGWGIISAADSGAPHKRERWFCVAFSNTESRRRAHQPERSNRTTLGIPFLNPSRRTHRGDTASRIPVSGRTAARNPDMVGDTECRRHPRPQAFIYPRTDAERNAQAYKRARRAIIHAALAGRPNVVNTTSKRPQGWQQANRRAYSAEIGTGMVAGLKRPSKCELYTEGHGRFRSEIAAARQRQAQSQRNGGSISGRSSRSKPAQVESRMGRNAPDGIPSWLARPQWAARPGEPQYINEAPRTVPHYKGRKAQLQAIGNAVVPAVIYPLAVEIRNWLETHV